MMFLLCFIFLSCTTYLICERAASTIQTYHVIIIIINIIIIIIDTICYDRRPIKALPNVFGRSSAIRKHINYFR